MVADAPKAAPAVPPMKIMDPLSPEAMYEFMLGYEYKKGGQKYKLQRQIPKAVNVCVVSNYVVLLREKWQNWAFFEESASVTNFKKKQQKTGFYTERDVQREPTSERAGPMAEFCASVNSNLFDVVCCLQVAQISNVLIHEGKDPSVEVKCFGGSRSMVILFTGDMERQRFVESIHSMMKKKHDGESDDEAEELA